MLEWDVAPWFACPAPRGSIPLQSWGWEAICWGDSHHWPLFWGLFSLPCKNPEYLMGQRGLISALVPQE